MKNALPIAVSLPASLAAVADGSLLREITRIGATRARYVEFRVDREPRMLGADGVSPAFQELLDTLVYASEKANLESIITCRVVAEGGEFQPPGDAAHLAILEAMIAARPDYIDVEIGSGGKILARVVDACEAHYVKMILSHHDRTGTPLMKDLVPTLAALTGKLEAVPGVSRDNAILKIVFTATRAEDNLIPFKVIDLLDMDDWTSISFCMGPLGWLSRVGCVVPRKGQAKSSAITYASSSESLAPGQLQLDLVEALLSQFT